jgi:tetratricopeptide (TPR) repeat protein
MAMSNEHQNHISGDMLERFFLTQLSEEETQWLVRHLLTSCPQCLETAALVGRRSGIFLPEGELDAAEELPAAATSVDLLGIFQQCEEERTRRARERVQGAVLLAELERRPAAERLALVQQDARFHHRGLFDQLLEKYLESARNEPRSGIDQVSLALVVLDLLPTDRYKPALLNDLRVAGLAALGNAQRLAGLFEEAKQPIASAWELLEDGSGDPLEEANLLSIEASLWRDMGQLDRSAGILDRAIQIYRQIGDDHRCARMLIQKGLAVRYAKPARGIKILEDALSLLDHVHDPRLELCAWHNLALFLNDAGEPREALATLEMTRPLYLAFGDRHTQLLLHWLEARIARSLDHLTEAEAVLKRVTAEFERRGMRHEQAIAALDLVQVHSLHGSLH